METRLADWIKETPEGRRADEILRACVHCGFCLATCPTYQLLGDELDSPRGRIYQIKQVLEGVAPTRETQLHLDRCLTCRSCETTCPSGVKYGQLVDVGRAAVDQRVERPWHERFYRWILREAVSRPSVFGPALQLGRAVRWALPASLRSKVGQARPAGAIPTRVHSRKVLLLNNCVQRSMAPSIDAATARVLDSMGVQSIFAPGSSCCGAIRQHLDDPAGALRNARRNIDAWWPFIESQQVEAVVINASGCGAMVKEYGHLLRHDAAYADKAARVSNMTRDLVELVCAGLGSAGPGTGERVSSELAPPEPAAAADAGGRPSRQGRTADRERPTELPRRVAFHPPCTLQHGLQIRGKVEALLRALGAELVPVRDGHLCCGSAGTYSLLQPELSSTLRTQKLQSLLENQPEIVLSANIGCIAHLQADTRVPVWHWIEWVDAALH
jgi:glycolate oxidase iron-sulfur subunit